MIAEMVREMVSKGVDIEVICLAVETAERAILEAQSVTESVTERDMNVTSRVTGCDTSERDSHAASRREKARIRQARRREKLRVTRDSVTNGPIYKKKYNKKERARATQVTPDWQPNEELRAWSISELGTVARVEKELEKFRDHFGANGKTAKNWGLAWRNWVRRSLEYSPLVKPPPNLSIVGEKITVEEAVAQFAKLGRLSRYSPINDISQAPPELLAKHGLLPDGRKSA